MSASKSKFITDEREPQDPKILIWDIETAPVLGYMWGAYEQNLLWKAHDWYLLTISWRWEGEKKVNVLGLDDFPESYAKNSKNDYPLVKQAWDLFNEAHQVVAHNGVAFDTKKAKARMIIQGFPPNSPFKEVDTLKIAKKYFKFTKNRLGDVCEALGYGTKAETGGLSLWTDIVEHGDPKAWAKMKKYNKQDVELLTKLYHGLRPWAERLPNLATMADRPDACPICLSEVGMKRRGYYDNNLSVRVKFRCDGCGGYSPGREIFKTETKFT